MAKGRGGRGPSRMDLRRESEAVEARERDEEKEEAEEEEEEEEAESDADEGDDEAPKKKTKKAKAPKKAPAAKKPAAKRTRAAKEVRRQAVWVVYDNSQKEVQVFPFNQKAEAEELLARKIQEKEGKATFYLNLVKKPLEEKD